MGWRNKGNCMSIITRHLYQAGIRKAWFHYTNLTFPDLSPVASVCPSGLIRRHLTPALWESLLESRMFFIAEKKSLNKCNIDISTRQLNLP